MVAALLVFPPIRALEETIKHKEWFKGVVLSATYFEHFGLEKLKEKYRGMIDPQKIENLSLEQIIMFLHISGLIDQPTYSRMIEVKNARNNLVHEPWANVVMTPEEAKKIIEKAIECLKFLGVE
jgi:hypothetical protein